MPDIDTRFAVLVRFKKDADPFAMKQAIDFLVANDLVDNRPIVQAYDANYGSPVWYIP